jgi:CheY-like chemotaxis protein
MRTIIVDDDATYRKRLKKELEALKHNVCETNDEDEAKSESGADLIILDDYKLDGTSYWGALLAPMRTRNPDATILLVSGYSDEDLAKHLSNLEGEAKELLGTDPFVQFLPKRAKEKGGNELHLQHVKLFAQEAGSHIGNRHALQQVLIESAFDASRRLGAMKLGELREPAAAVGKGDTLQMDIIAEKCIAEHFAPEMHFKNVMICTEEAGVHNKLYHRVQKPAFFVFSDPFDGSSAFKALLEELSEAHKEQKNPRRALFSIAEIARKTGINQESRFCDLTKSREMLAAWDKTMGYHGLNAPMVSMVLAERHRVTGAVLVNLFTRDVYVSLSTGNFWRHCPRLDEEDIKRLTTAIRDNSNPEGWKRLSFRGYDEVSASRLFLGTLSAVKRSKEPPEITCFNAHGETCLSPMMRTFLDWEASFRYRLRQHDFTPGPGRVLFLTNAPQVLEYEKISLDSNHYRCILSIGEPFTEWIGWFAFLRHAPGLAACCLRRKGESRGHCEHRRDLHDPMPLLPQELGSVFRCGHIDIGVLSTAYGERMRSYNDTVLVHFRDDPAWRKVLETAEGEDLCVRIPLFNQANSQGPRTEVG